MWSLVGLLGAWLLLWRRVGDRWGWFGMLNAWMEWGVALLGGLGVLAALRRQGGRALLALSLAAAGAAWLPPLLAVRRGTRLGETGGGASFTLFSANLYKLNASAAAHIALVRQQQPDLVCLHELQPALADEWVAALGDCYPHRALRPEVGAYGFGVLSRFPLEETGYWERPGVRPWAQRVRCTLPTGDQVELYNVHLVPPAADSTVEQGLTWGFRAREAQVRLMQEEIAGRGLPACVVGDHNFADTSDAYRMMCEHLRDGWAEAGQGVRWTWPTRAFPWESLPWNPRMLRLDYCFYNEPLRAERMRVLAERTGSDHCPLLVTLRLR